MTALPADVEASAVFFMPKAEIRASWEGGVASSKSMISVKIDFQSCDKGAAFGAELVDFDLAYEEFGNDPDFKELLKEASAEIADQYYNDEGDSLRVLRLRSGLSQYQLAVALRTSQPYIARLEAGQGTDVKRLTMRRLAAALGVDVNKIDQALQLAAEAAQSREG